MLTPFGELPNKLAVDMSLAEQHDWLSRRTSRRSLLLGVAASAASPTLWRQAERSYNRLPVVNSRTLAFGPDPATSIVVSFSTYARGISGAVEVTSEEDSLTATAQITAVPGSQRRYCRAAFTALTPDTEYKYTVTLDNRRVSKGRFRTMAKGPQPIRFTACGDQGVTAEAQQMLKRLQLLAPQFHLMAGDLCYADSTGLGGTGDVFRPGAWDRWLDQIDSLASTVAWSCVPGNHEMEPGFATHGYGGYLSRVSPSGTSPLGLPVSSTFQVGNVGFVGLDSNDVSYEIPANRGWTGNAQTAWLDRTLNGYRSGATGVDFIVVFMHHTPYSTNNAHACEGGVREEWVPLFDRHSVDLVISGHNHAYERTLPLRKGQVTSAKTDEVDSSRGTSYVTAGGGGAPSLNHPTFIPFPHKTRVNTGEGKVVEVEDWLESRTSEHAVLCVDVAPGAWYGGESTMRLRAIGADGRVLDDVTLRRNAQTNKGIILAAAGGAVAAVAASGAAVGHKMAGRAKT